MSGVHPVALEGSARFVCAQADCKVCVEHLLRQHRKLVHWVIRRDCASTTTAVYEVSLPADS